LRRRALRVGARRRQDRQGHKDDLDLDTDDLKSLVESFEQIVSEHAERDFPQDPREQLNLAIPRRPPRVERAVGNPLAAP